MSLISSTESLTSNLGNQYITNALQDFLKSKYIYSIFYFDEITDETKKYYPKGRIKEILLICSDSL